MSISPKNEFEWENVLVNHGVFLSATSSLFNHDCRPNVKLDSLSPQFFSKMAENMNQDGSSDRFYWPFRWIAARHIEEGEELTINYLGYSGNNLLDRETRRSILKNKWGFDCDCQRCREESKV